MPTALPRPGGLIFDLDGTLVDTVSARIDGWVEALTAIDVPARPEQIAPKIGMDGRRLAREVAADAGRELSDHELEEVDKAAGEGFDRRNGAPRALPGVHAVLETLSAEGIPWVIATSSRAQQVKGSVAALDLGHEPKIVDGSHVKHAKPAPDLLLLAADKLGVAPERCWAVGDATWDVRAAVAGGITAIGVTAGSAVSREDLLGAGAAAVIISLEELPRLLADR
ncbi:MAG TPA: HAD family phosphatase [Candidatus Limnocylindrales bacterium]|nr:HAD family phosphatase [Candidatus Limnocylindrales bacterium]